MTSVAFEESAFVPLAVGFFGLGTGYLIYGAQELFRLPERSWSVDLTTGIWGVDAGLHAVSDGHLSLGRSCPGFILCALRYCIWRRSHSPPTACTGSPSGSLDRWAAIRARTNSWRSHSRCCRSSEWWFSSRRATGQSDSCSWA